VNKNGQSVKGVKKALLACSLLAVTAAVTGCASTNRFDHLSSDDKASTFNAELGTSYLAAGELENAETKLQRALEQANVPSIVITMRFFCVIAVVQRKR